MLPKLLIWDWNGTILDDWELCYTIENEMLNERSMQPITKSWYLAHFSFPIKAYYEAMGYTFEHESYERVSEIFMERYNARYSLCKLRDGAIDVLKQAKAKGVAQTLLSVTRQEDLILQAQHFGAAQYFSELLGQTDILGNSKVERAKTYMQKCGIDPESALFIGDTNHDFETANAVGCRCALLSGGHQSTEVLRRCGVPVFESTEELWKWIVR